MFKGLKNNSLKKSPLRPHRNWEERCDDQWSVNKIKKKNPPWGPHRNWQTNKFII
jgi:hypothetical protein